MGTHYEGTDEEITTLNAFIKMTRANETISTRLNRHLSEADITVSQFGVLEALLHLGPLNQKSLGEKLLKSGGNITMVIDNLERCNYVERQRDPEDRRSVLINLTDEGRTFIQSFFPKHLEVIKQEFSVLSKKEKEQLASICKKLGLGSDGK